MKKVFVLCNMRNENTGEEYRAREMDAPREARAKSLGKNHNNEQSGKSLQVTL